MCSYPLKCFCTIQYQTQHSNTVILYTTIVFCLESCALFSSSNTIHWYLLNIVDFTILIWSHVVVWGLYYSCKTHTLIFIYLLVVLIDFLHSTTPQKPQISLSRWCYWVIETELNSTYVMSICRMTYCRSVHDYLANKKKNEWMYSSRH